MSCALTVTSGICRLNLCWNERGLQRLVQRLGRGSLKEERHRTRRRRLDGLVNTKVVVCRTPIPGERIWRRAQGSAARKDGRKRHACGGGCAVTAATHSASAFGSIGHQARPLCKLRFLCQRGKSLAMNRATLRTAVLPFKSRNHRKKPFATGFLKGRG